MQISSEIITTPPIDAATVLLLRDGMEGLEVLLLKRHSASTDLGGTFVFPGGKLDAGDAAPGLLAQLSHSATDLHAQLAEPELTHEHAASLFVAVMRECFEECGLLLSTANPSAQFQQDHQAGMAWPELLWQHRLNLNCQNVLPWSRWITPRMPSLMSKRFDTRFFLAQAPTEQTAAHDNHETTESLWIAPRQALIRYWHGEIVLAPPQIMSLSHLNLFENVQAAMQHARQNAPALIQPEPFDQDGMRVICYPGDPRHSNSSRALPGPTRLHFRNKRFEPDGGLAALLHNPP